MKKLFEIPVYALSASKLNTRTNKRIADLKALFSRSDPDEAAFVIDHETFPMRSWDYNHIIGYIRIAVSKTDILFDVFMPIPIPERYVWNTKQKSMSRILGQTDAHLLGLTENHRKIPRGGFKHAGSGYYRPYS